MCEKSHRTFWAHMMTWVTNTFYEAYRDVPPPTRVESTRLRRCRYHVALSLSLMLNEPWTFQKSSFTA
jgi:hypothetical protein